LHKVQVDHSDKNPYHRTTMHIAQSGRKCAQHLSAPSGRFAALAASNLPAQIYDLSTHAAFIERILEQFQRLEDNAQTEACEAFLVMQLMTCLPEQPQPYPPRQQTVASRIMSWVEAHYASKFSLDRLAHDLGLAKLYLTHFPPADRR
jgi:YesN/AraC family two-component response regulator